MIEIFNTILTKQIVQAKQAVVLNREISIKTIQKSVLWIKDFLQLSFLRQLLSSIQYLSKRIIDSAVPRMLPNFSTLPNIFNLHIDRSILDLKNQYSIVNKLKSRDILGNFSMELQNKLPLINKRIRYFEDKQNDLLQRELKMASSKQTISHLQKDLDDMKKFLLYGQNHCCCKSHGFPMMMPLQQKQNGNNKNQRHSLNANRDSRGSFQSSQNLGKGKNQNKAKRARRNFRKVVYAVYFFIFLKYFSMKFTKNRFQFFKQRYLSNDGQKVKEDSYKITKTLQGIDLMNIIVQSKDTISENVSALNLEDVSSQNLKQFDKLIPSKMSSQFEKALNFINIYIKQLQTIVLSPKFIDFYGEIIGIGTINQSFFMDDLMIPQEIQFITFSEKKGFAQISPETQKILIMSYIYIKHIMFKILLKLKDKKYLESKLKGIYDKFEDEKEEIYEFLELATAIMYSLVNTIFLEYLQNAPKTNYDKLKKRFKISPAKVLAAPNCPKNLKENINYEELIVGVPKINEITTFLQDQKYDDYLGYLVELIQSFSKKLLESVKYVNRAIYDHIKPETLNQKYLIFEGIKHEKNPKIDTAKKIPGGQKSGGLNLQNNLSNTSLGANSKLIKKNKR